ncbi:MAG: hypothetical protein EBT13_10705 [Rhodobacteraceae bacterium]|jgi:hypothetical protein|nr:hypothetical protein [Paracoccaceae bacterium]
MDEEMMEGGEGGDACPAATGDLTLNLKNRGKAIDKADYGPMDPNLPNRDYWQRMANRWDETPENAKKMRCGNCSAFNQTSKMLKCIEDGLSEDRMQDAMEVVDAGDLGFCELFDFKCAANRTCAAWIVGGPITDEKEGDMSEDDMMDEEGEYDETD